MLVADASIIAPVVADKGPDGVRLRRRLRRQHIAAPDLLGVEVVSVILRQLRMGGLEASQAARAVDDLLELPISLYPTDPLLRRCWDLRDHLTAYDATDIALAEALDCAVLTTDARLSRAPGIRCTIELA